MQKHNRLLKMPEKHPQGEAEAFHTPIDLTHGVDNLYRNTLEVDNRKRGRHNVDGVFKDQR